MLEYILNRVKDFNVGYFVNDLANASKNLGILEAKIDSYQFDSILIPMLQKKEAISSMYARFSSHSQTEQSIEGQLKVCYAYAEANQMNVVGEYIDRAQTGTNDNRPSL